MKQPSQSMKKHQEDPLPHSTHSFQLLVSQLPRYRTLEQESHQESNIFKVEEPTYIGEERESRPIGGKALLKRMDLIQEYKKRKVSKGKIKLLEARDVASRGKDRKRVKTQVSLPSKTSFKKRSETSLELPQETLKSHHSYSHQTISHHPSNSKADRPTAPQTKFYLDKAALLGEMSSNHNMIEHSGQKYFEMSLRNRWRDQLKVDQYVYLIKPGEPFTNNKLIQQLRKYRPDIKERQMLLLQGRKLKKRNEGTS